MRSTAMRNRRSKMKPITQMVSSATKMRLVCSRMEDCCSRKPMPESAARISAGMMLMKDDAIAMRMPVTMYGAAEGITTRRKICSSLAPRHCAARWRMTGARITPAVVLMSTMKKVPQKMRKYFEVSRTEGVIFEQYASNGADIGAACGQLSYAMNLGRQRSYGTA